MDRRKVDGTIWQVREIKIFGFVIWHWNTKRLTTAELMRRIGIR